MRKAHAVLMVVSALSLAACSEPLSRATHQTPDCGLKGSDIGGFITVPAGSFVAGAQPVYPEEGPALRVHVSAFEIQRHEVTNDQFATFVTATGYQSDAERSAKSNRPDAGSAVFARGDAMKVALGEWALVKGAMWLAPEGPGSTIEGKGNWPVLHVSYRDAVAYASWAKARLPSEVEWEYAAHLGLPDKTDSRSGAYDPKGAPLANTWQGLFPVLDEGGDGFLGAAPVGCFPPDRMGLSDMIGNVWEWTAALEPPSAEAVAGMSPPTQALVKGGSHLCTETFCGRFRPEARQAQDVDFSTNHIGFRVVRDRAPPR